MSVFPKDWPFKGKPVTNRYVKCLIVVVAYFVWLMALARWWPQTVLFTVLVVLGLLLGSIYRQIRAEWK